jgi:hypothetical protein
MSQKRSLPGLSTLSLAAALTVFAALPALAADPPAEMAMPAPAAELSQLAFFVGHWSCTGKVEATPFGAAHATRATVDIKSDFGGFWSVGRYEEPKTAENPHPMSFEFLMGYDASAFTLDGFDAFGGRSHQTSSGWKDGTMVFLGTTGSGGQNVPARDTFTQKGPKSLGHVGEIQIEGKWTQIDAETCTR